jgi:uncharacterized phage-associated protein
MFPNFSFKPEKANATVKLILSNLPGRECNFHKLFKILYFAEQSHLVKYGRPITGDKYIAMQAGPVPSNIYNIMKILRGDSIFSTTVDFSKDFEVKRNHYVHMLNENVDLDIFSESEIECITNSIAENKNLSFAILKEKSHDYAWTVASKDDSMSVFDIAKSAGAGNETLKYISLKLENKTLS